MSVIGNALIRYARWRHALIVLLALLLVYLFGVVHGQWSDMHRWNRATADASFVLLTITMALGPTAQLWPRLRLLIPFRRELGIYAVMLAAIHTVIILGGWIVWDFARLFGFEFHPGLGRYVMVQHGFGLANAVGVLALVYGLTLALTSSDRLVRLLGGPVWKFVQRAAYVLWALVVVHTGYFLFLQFLDYHRQTPAPNPLQPWYLVLIGLVLVLRISASVHLWISARKQAVRRQASLA
ncbi:MAG: ferric reductase-like transmembrane domain-containing protein [Mesorhizobium sp.]|nr:ferric reductase-like transmembrane domain-containing protein [Mesorhizobium sp.]